MISIKIEIEYVYVFGRQLKIELHNKHKKWRTKQVPLLLIRSIVDLVKTEFNDLRTEATFCKLNIL